MLGMPTGLYPNGEAIVKDGDTLTLTAYMSSSSNLKTFNNGTGVLATVWLRVGNTEYKVVYDGSDSVVGNGYASLEKLNNSYKIIFRIDKQTHVTKRITNWRGIVVDTGLAHSIALLKTGIAISWRFRIYESEDVAVRSVKLGYGYIDNVTKCHCASQTENNDTYIYHVAPHTFIGSVSTTDRLNKHNTTDTSTEELIKASQETLNKVKLGYDKYAKYYINAEGTQRFIFRYTFHDYIRLVPYSGEKIYNQDNQLVTVNTGGSSENNPDSSETTCQYLDKWDKYFDAYGSPIYGYIVTGTEKVDANGDSIGVWYDTNDVYHTGSSYSILCNYIDSKWAHFEIYEDPDIVLKSNITTTESDGTSPGILEQSSLDITGCFDNNYKVGLNYYSYKIYSNAYSEEEECEYSSGNIYNSEIDIKYDCFVSNSDYTVRIIFTDVYSRTFERELKFKVQMEGKVTSAVVTAQYYPPHGSVIIDWTKLRSISPNIPDDKVSYKNITINGENYATVIADADDSSAPSNVAAYIERGEVATWTNTDLGDEIDYDNCNVSFEFTADDVIGTMEPAVPIFELKGKLGTFYQVNYTKDRYIEVIINNRKYTFDLYNGASSTTEAISKALKPATKYVYNEDVYLNWNAAVEYNESYYWHSERNLSLIWRVDITPASCMLRCVNMPNLAFSPTDGYDMKLCSDEPHVSIYGGFMYKNLIVESIENERGTALSDVSFDDYEVTNATRINCNFNNTVNGSNEQFSMKNCNSFRVYKTIGKESKLYQVGDIDVSDEIGTDGVDDEKVGAIYEDFAVGDNCEYQYYIYPTRIKEDGTEVICAPLVSNPLTIEEGVVKIFGMKETEENSNIFTVDTNTLWKFWIDLSDEGYTLNNDKNFVDTLATYNQEIVGNRKYITKSISGMLGAFDCNNKDGKRYGDTYEMLISWNNFVTSATPKCLIDIRGLILPGNFEANSSVKYQQGEGAYAEMNFTWRQKSDLDIIKIYGRRLKVNLCEIEYLQDSDGKFLTDNADFYLYYTKDKDESSDNTEEGC